MPVYSAELQHEHAVLRRHVGRVRHDPADREWLVRWPSSYRTPGGSDVFAVTPECPSICPQGDTPCVCGSHRELTDSLVAPSVLDMVRAVADEAREATGIAPTGL